MTTARARTVAAEEDLDYLVAVRAWEPDRADKLGDAIVSDAYYHFERHPQIAWISRWLN